MKFPHHTRQRGFSLFEVMISLVIISVGLLGVAKMQALAMTNTSVASVRSLAAIEAASLAATMHENRAYWTTNAPATNANGIKVHGSGPTAAPTITAAGLTFPAADCTSASGHAAPYCAADKLAAYDLEEWSKAVRAVLPNYDATITCTAVSPVSCTIAISWQERAVALTQQEADAQAAAAAAGTPYLQAPAGKPYTLFVEP
jgi:type IV pilus assembly protein PilV